MNYSGIILDVDGTIWNTTRLTAAAWNKAIKSVGGTVPLVTEEILQTQFGKTMDVIADNLFAGVTGAARELLLTKCYEYEHTTLLENHTDIMYPTVYRTINQLRKKIPFYVVSNCQKGYIELMLEKTKMTGMVNDVECFGNTGLGKAQNIRLLVERNHIERPVYVGDTQGDADECAKVCVPFIWAAYGFGRNVRGYSEKLDSFDDLMKVIN